MKKVGMIVVFIGLGLFSLIDIASTAEVVTRGEQVFIKDRTGELWDVTQAQVLGFEPDRFQYGIGRHAFTPLAQKDLSDAQVPLSEDDRVIGISGNGESHAYRIDRLRRHEVANTFIGESAIVAGY